MPRPFLAVALLALASIAVAQLQPTRALMPLSRSAHAANGSPKQAADNLHRRAEYLQSSVDELVRFVKSDPNLDERNRKLAEDIAQACREERKLIDEEADRLGAAEQAAGLGAAEPAGERQASIVERVPITIPLEPRFE